MSWHHFPVLTIQQFYRWGQEIGFPAMPRQPSMDQGLRQGPPWFPNWGCHGSLQRQCCLPLSLSESHFILGSLPHPTPLPTVCFALRVPTKGKPIENRESTFYTVMRVHKGATIGTVMTSHLLKRTKMIKKNPPFTFITEELLLNPEFQSTFFQNSARWSGRGQGEGQPLAQHCPWPPPAPCKPPHRGLPPTPCAQGALYLPFRSGSRNIAPRHRYLTA